MSAGEYAALIAAGAFLLWCAAGDHVVQTREDPRRGHEAIVNADKNTDPLLAGANQTITHVNTQLERVDGITANAQAVTGNVSALSSVFTATLGGPL